MLPQAIRASPEKALPLLALAKDDRLLYKKLAKLENDDEKPFHETYMVLQQVPISFLKDFMPVAIGSEGEVTVQSLSKWEKVERGTVQALFFAGWCLSGKSKWPKFCNEKDIFRKTLAAAYGELGARLQYLKTKKNHLGQEIVDWDLSGAWQLRPADDEKKTIAWHRFENKEFKLESPVTLSGDQAKIYKNWIELSAFVKLGRREVPIIDLLSDGDALSLKTNRFSSELLNDLASKHHSAHTANVANNATVATHGLRANSPAKKAPFLPPPTDAPQRAVNGGVS